MDQPARIPLNRHRFIYGVDRVGQERRRFDPTSSVYTPKRNDREGWLPKQLGARPTTKYMLYDDRWAPDMKPQGSGESVRSRIEKLRSQLWSYFGSNEVPRCRSCFMNFKHRPRFPTDKVPVGLSDIDLMPCGCVPLDGMVEELFVNRGLLSPLEENLHGLETRGPVLDDNGQMTHLGLDHRGVFMRFLEWFFGGNLQPQLFVSRKERALAMLAASDLHRAIVFDTSTQEGKEAWMKFRKYQDLIESTNDGWRTTLDDPVYSEGDYIKVDTDDF